MNAREHTDVEVATNEDEQRVVDTITLAFCADPIIRWFFPTPHAYQQYFPELVRAYGGKAFEHESAYYAGEFAAASLWLPPGVDPDDDALVELFLNALPEKRQPHALEAAEELERYHPTEPFWHLPFIGAEPYKQRKGYGSALMKYATDVCDREGTVAYLESTNAENISLYVRHGFEILGTVRIGSMPPLFPMVRRPE